VLRADSPRPILFVASEAGFAPVKGLIEHAMSLDRAELLHLYWHTQRPAGHYLANLCRSWAGALDNFRYTACDEGGAADLVGRMARDHADLAAFDVYAAGPGSFVQEMDAALQRNRFPASQLRLEIV
jgi:CDP-4-dehydro-6-deoxyglucose reductase